MFTWACSFSLEKKNLLVLLLPWKCRTPEESVTRSIFLEEGREKGEREAEKITLPEKGDGGGMTNDNENPLNMSTRKRGIEEEQTRGLNTFCFVFREDKRKERERENSVRWQGQQKNIYTMVIEHKAPAANNFFQKQLNFVSWTLLLLHNLFMHTHTHKNIYTYIFYYFPI